MNKELIERYESIRDQLVPGSIGLVRGNSRLSKTIQWADDAHNNHSFLVFGSQTKERLMCLDANAPGVQPDFLSQRIGEYEDFTFLVPIGFSNEDLENAVNKAIAKDLQLNFKYDVWLLPKILTAKKLGFKVKHNLDTNRTICSVFTAYHYGGFLGETNWVNETKRKNYFTPEDHIRFLSPKWKIVRGK